MKAIDSSTNWLMHINTGSVACAQDWLCDYADRDSELSSLSFEEWHKGDLINVEWINDEWKEIK